MRIGEPLEEFVEPAPPPLVGPVVAPVTVPAPAAPQPVAVPA